MDVSGKGRYRQGLDALASSRGSVTGAWLAVLWCPTLGIPVISGLALLTLGALCVVLAALCGGGRMWVEAEPLEATDPWGRKEGGWDSPGRHLFRAHRPLYGHGSCNVRRCPGRGRWACVYSLCHSPGGRKMTVEGLPQQGLFWEGTTGWLGRAWGGGRAKGGGVSKHRGGSWLDRWVGPRAHLAGWATVPRWAGTLLHFQCRVLAGVLRHSHIHADARDPGCGKTHCE